MSAKFTIPIAEDQVRRLHIGDQVSAVRVLFTGRDAAHKYMKETFIARDCPPAERAVYDVLKPGLAGGVIYHCGPVVRKREDGRTSSSPPAPRRAFREEPYEAAVIEHFGLRAVIGKGGMAPRRWPRARSTGASISTPSAGAATLIAESVKEVIAVHSSTSACPKRFWQIRVEDFPCVVTMDAHGQSLHEHIEHESRTRLEALLKTT